MPFIPQLSRLVFKCCLIVTNAVLHTDCDVCEAKTEGLVRYPTTLAPVSGSVTVTTQCADDAHITSGSSLSVRCESDGTWSATNVLCECDEGYEVGNNDNGRETCQGRLLLSTIYLYVGK